MRRTLLLLLLACLCGPLSAAGDGWAARHLEYGLEWGYTATFLYSYHFNYLSESVGARIDSRDALFSYTSNGHVQGFAGVRFARRFAVDAVVGWAGIYEERRVYPVTLRGTCFFPGYDRDGWKVFAEGGVCSCASFADKGVAIVKAGFGRRLMLDRKSALDLSVSLQGVSDHPTGVYDLSRGVSVPKDNLRRSDCNYLALNISIGLCF